MNMKNISIQNKNFKDLNPLLCGTEACAPGHSFGPHVRDHYIIHYVISGSGTFENQNGIYTVETGEIFLIRPDEVTFYQASEETPWNYIWIGFSGELAKQLDAFPDVHRLKHSSVFFDMLQCENMSSMREEFLTAQLFLLFRELFKKLENSESHTRRVSNYIKCNYMQNISVEGIAHFMHLDRRYLSRIFKEDYKISIKEYIIKERMSHAATLLTDGYSVRQTASMVGYTDVFNFSKMFKQTYGVSPSMFNKS